MHPKARRTNLQRTDLDGQAIVFDEKTDQVHHLDAITATVYDLADGERSTDDLSRAVADKTGVPSERELVSLALSELSQAGLLEEGWQNDEPHVNRRDLTRRLAIAGALAVALPLVMTMTAQPAAAQVTG